MPETPVDIIVRRARADDAPRAGPLIYAAEPRLFDLLFGPGEPDAVSLFSRLFKLRNNIYSWQFAWIAEADGIRVGIALAAPVRARQRAARAMWRIAPSFRQALAMLRRLPEMLAVVHCFSTPPRDAYYLSILSVDPQYQGKGIGAALLWAVIAEAVDTDSARVMLHVECGNTAAQRFYARHGFIERQRKDTSSQAAARSGITGFIAMERFPAQGD